MRIWIVKEGEKEGPFEEYQLRGRIQSGDLDADTPAWYEGMEKWGCLRDITVFAGEFDAKKGADVEELLEALEPFLEKGKEEELPTPYRGLKRRFFARWVEILVYQTLLFALFVLTGKDLYDFIGNQSFLIFHLIPLFLLEAWILSQWGTTPGKALMRLKVETGDGASLSYLKALLRTARVWFLGVGALMPLLLLIGHVLGAISVKKFGAALWDFRSKQYVVKTGKVSGRSWGTVALLIVVSLFLQLNLWFEPMVRFLNANKEQLSIEQRQQLEELNQKLEQH